MVTPYTYAIEMVGHGLVKIGKASNPDARFSVIQSCCPYELRFLDILEGDCEAVLHEMFAHLRVRGEWFTLDDKILRTLKCLDSAPNRIFKWKMACATPTIERWLEGRK